MIKPTLILQPIHNSSADILKTFKEGKPLSSDQWNFIASHEHALSSGELDPLLRYYLESDKKHRKHMGNFLLPHEELNKEDIKKLKERIRILLEDKYSHVAVQATEKQYKAFKAYAASELIYWGGQEFLSGAKFYVGGVIPAIFFQWEDYFGVWKYAMIHEGEKLRLTSMLYFERLNERSLNQCVLDYKQNQQIEITHQQKLFYEDKKIITEDQDKKIQHPGLTHHYHIDHFEK